MSTGTHWRRRLLSFEFVAGFVLTGGMVALVLMSDLLFPDGGAAMDLTARLQPPGHSVAHILGTDPLGRDVLARVVVGGQVSLTVGVVSVLGAVIAGVAAGLLAGYYRGVWDLVLMRWADVQLALPFILIAITFAAILGADMWNLIAFMAIAQWVQYARVVRGAVLSLREREYVQSARSFGVGDLKILWRHILPNAMGPVIILMTSWGGMLADGRSYLQSAWWVGVFPGLAIMLTVLGLNLLGDWFRDVLDPTSRVGI
jgi:peptide/nickel transport system permease protein